MTDSTDTGALADMATTADILRATMKELQGLSRGFTADLTGGLKSAIIEGRKLDDALRDIGKSISSKLLDKALKPLENLLSTGLDGLFASLETALNGAATSAGMASTAKSAPGDTLIGSAFKALSGVFGFAKGGVVSSPVAFSLGGGDIGVAGEAGSEAILPLARGADGRLGVRGPGAGGVNVTFNVTASDADSFRKSEAQVTTMLARAVGRGRRGL